ncbi:MAG: hypothetical protein COC19_05800 [SAR86 cluster bacterium]|uniref:Uncharacterized protein n=1 Tax=SAR86 cluster bacterium TaxID=2030880 RepID=A0A2A4MK07_9GAMM|nr:MAG: hypothetical protein COC19_05800 [SAR86 cluster bacterium]
MDVVLPLIALLITLTLIVLALHRYQLRANRSSLSKSQPLPPLAYKPREHSAPQSNAQIKQISSAAANLDQNADHNSKHTTGPKIEPHSGAGKKSWTERLRDFKKRGELDSALTLCKSQFPLLGAYSQALIILRAKIKTELSIEQPIESLLEELYHLASLAELLHDQTDKKHGLKPKLLKQQNLQTLTQLPMPYAHLGFENLHLTRVSDHKLFILQWGTPEQHLRPRHFHLNQWQAFTDKASPNS